MKTHRVARVSEVIREVAAETILFEIQDPRVKGVTVTRAEVSGDLQHAKVYVSVMGSKKDQDLCMHGLQHSAGFIQRKLGARMKTRFTPTITFVRDDGVKNSLEIARLIQEAYRMPTASDEEAGGENADSLAPDEQAQADSESARNANERSASSPTALDDADGEKKNVAGAEPDK